MLTLNPPAASAASAAASAGGGGDASGGDVDSGGGAAAAEEEEEALTDSSSSLPSSSPLSGYQARPRTYKWGAQGLYFSDGATRRALADCYRNYTARSYERQHRYKDWPLKVCLGQLGVAVFDSGRSLVQHIGASSSLFGGAGDNSRFHRACSFPFVERLPAEDGREDWF
ncbi:hypothetical protein GPECTOR_22g881 [Gonium pectorale]|uniref:Uncharacterized protein n=1 Tax=Gonium pectorale TaxID=33097 RepID=A0A150GHK0_GONPE|nr:hypothetical protein GPECTOR_22g881 [Gonium pectorale]|eukprot:KXZ49287.1 hypothetical protein GPECTOR_22g881 [Gonium pectorale]